MIESYIRELEKGVPWKERNDSLTESNLIETCKLIYKRMDTVFGEVPVCNRAH